MSQDIPFTSRSEKAAAISEGIAQPALTPGANLKGIYDNLRVPGATTKYQLFDLLLRRIEEGKPVNWESVSDEVTTRLKTNQESYNAVLIRMLEKNWIDAPVQQKTVPFRIFESDVAHDLLDGDSEAEIAEAHRTTWRQSMEGIDDPALKAACVWYMEQLENSRPHAVEDWISHAGTTGAEKEPAQELLLRAISHLANKQFIVEIDDTVPFDENDRDVTEKDVVNIAQEMIMVNDIHDGRLRLEAGNMEALETTIERYAREAAEPANTNVRTVQYEFLRRVRDNESTAWADIYATIRDRLDATMNEEGALAVYMHAIDTNLHRGIIRKRSKE